MFIIIVFWLGCDRPSRLLYFMPALLLSILTQRGRVDAFFNFRLYKSILFFVNWILLYFFHILLNTTIFCSLLLYFDQDVIDRQDFFFRACFASNSMYSLACTPLFLPSSSVSLSYFVLAVSIRECFWKHSCMSSPFPVAIYTEWYLLFFPTEKLQVYHVYSERKTRNIVH